MTDELEQVLIWLFFVQEYKTSVGTVRVEKF